jgi:hypothetical protein
MPTTFLSLPREIRQQVIYLALEDVVFGLEVRDYRLMCFGAPILSQCACASTGERGWTFACFLTDMSKCPAVRKYGEETKVWFRGIQDSSAVVKEDLGGAFPAWKKALSRTVESDMVLRMRNRMMLGVLRDSEMRRRGISQREMDYEEFVEEYKQ